MKVNNIKNNILILGQVYIDLMLTSSERKKLRFGGIVHSARTLWALDENYSVAYFGPNYLDNQLNKYLSELGCENIYNIGIIEGAPNIQLISYIKETKKQIYEDLLFEHRKHNFDIMKFQKLLKENNFQKTLVFPDDMNIEQILEVLSTYDTKVFIDINYLEIDVLKRYNKKIDTLII